MDSKLFIIFIVFLSAEGDDTRNGTITSYDPSELLLKILNTNGSIPRQRFKFEDNPPSAEDQGQYGLISFEDAPHILDLDEGRPLKFEDTQDNGVRFQDDNDLGNQNTRKRKRRRKPKRVPGSVRPGYPGVPGPYQQYGPGYGYGYEQPGPQGAPFRYPRRPRPSLASEALSAVTGALTSIALYDDYQCVPRLLCEAAGGGALGSSGVLDSVSGIQPLLTLLSAYNGISTSPLFVFGRAVFLGMTSKGNTGTCRYAYSQCPTDPEQLIYYLNNYNGGFFRFFNAPPNQNLQQFYQHLGQNFGQYQNQQYQPDQVYNQGYGHNPYQPDQQIPGGYGQQGLYGNQNYGQNYAYDYNNYGNKIRFRDSKEIEERIQNRPPQDSGDGFEDDDDNFVNFNNKWAFPDEQVLHDVSNFNENDNKRVRESKTLRFPEDITNNNYHTTDSNRKGKQINFPNTFNSNRYYNNANRIKYMNYNDFNNIIQQPNVNNNPNNNYYNNNNLNNDFNNDKLYNNDFNSNIYHNNYNGLNNNYNKDHDNKNNLYNYYNNKDNLNSNYNYNNLNSNDYYFDHKHNFYVKKDNNRVHNDNNNYSDNTVYIVRGNGDPNHPEIVKVRPGERVY